MTHQLTFASLYNYPTEAILLPVALRHGERIARADAHVDTGSTFCVFKRELGEARDLKIEAGDPLRLTTVTGTFESYGSHAYVGDAWLFIRCDGLFRCERELQAQRAGQARLARSGETWAHRV